MAKRKSSYWSSFWRETGANTGKWVSNKVFGNTGWATPRRHILDGELKTSSSRASRRQKKELEDLEAEVRTATRSSSSSTKEDPHLEFEKKLYKDKKHQETVAKIKSFKFGNDQNSICNSLEDLLVLFRAEENYRLQDAIKSKANVGIEKLGYVGDKRLARFYKKQFQTSFEESMSFKSHIRLIGEWALTIFIYIFVIYLIVLIFRYLF